MTRTTIYKTDREFLPNPVDPLYQTDEELISDADWIQDIYDEAVSLENKIAGDFDLDEIVSKIKISTLAYIKSGLWAFKVKQLKLYKQVCKTFKQFCTEYLGITAWQVNRNIRASQICIELIAHNFDVLPRCEAQARALISATADGEISVVDAWKSVTENIPPHQITAKSISNHLNPESEQSEPIEEKIVVKRNLFQRMQTAALSIGMSISQLLEEIFQPIVENCANYYYHEQVSRWQQDLQRLIDENQSLS